MASLHLGNEIPGEESGNGIGVASSYFGDFKICLPAIYIWLPKRTFALYLETITGHVSF